MMRYVRSRRLNIEQHDAGTWTITHNVLGTRLQVNKSAFRFLQLFDQPRALQDLANQSALKKAGPTIERFVRNGFLIEENHHESISDKIVQRPTPRFFHCPYVADTAQADVTFLGVPYDYGNTSAPGARYGPKALRNASAADFRYTLDFANQKPQGWYDNGWSRPILQGVTMADAGDIFIFPGESTQRIFEKITEVVEAVLARNSFPAILGGDHSITYPVLGAYKTDVDVIHIDAHSDFASYYPELENHHGNVMTRVLQLPHVGRFYQIGLRGTTPYREGRSNPRAALEISPRCLRQIGIEGVLEQIPKTGQYYVTFDIDALDPILAPGTSTPMPGGLGYEETKELLWAIGVNRRCIGFDLVEVNPEKDTNNITSDVAIDLLLTFLAAHFASKGNGHE